MVCCALCCTAVEAGSIAPYGECMEPSHPFVIALCCEHRLYGYMNNVLLSSSAEAALVALCLYFSLMEARVVQSLYLKRRLLPFSFLPILDSFQSIQSWLHLIVIPWWNVLVSTSALAQSVWNICVTVRLQWCEKKLFLIRALSLSFSSLTFFLSLHPFTFLLLYCQ